MITAFKKSPLATLITIAFALMFIFEASQAFAGADLSITAANVLSSGRQNNANIVNGVAGTTITAGQAVFANKALSGSYMLSSATASPSGSGTVTGIALNNAAPGQPLAVVTQDGTFQIGSGTLNIGDLVVVSGSNAGGLTLSSNIVAGENVMFVGVATSGSTINLTLALSGGTNTGTYP